MIKDKNLIFIASQPRSGSTLLQSLLSNNPYVETVSESWLLLPFLSIYKPKLIHAKYDYRAAAIAVNDFMGKIGSDLVFNDSLNKFLLSLYGQLQNEATKYILDKTPRYYEILFEIRSLFPNAKIILLKRNPFATLNSIIDTWGRANAEKLVFNYSRDILKAPFLIQDFCEKMQADPNVKTVIYEELVASPASSMETIYEWLGLPFEESVLNYANNNKYMGIMGDPVGIKKASQPIRKHIDTWMHKLENSYWKSFFQGYAAYLSADFLSKYGPYESIGEKNSGSFKYFKLLAENEFIYSGFSKKNWLRHFLYRKFGIKFLL